MGENQLLCCADYAAVPVDQGYSFFTFCLMQSVKLANEGGDIQSQQNIKRWRVYEKLGRVGRGAISA